MKLNPSLLIRKLFLFVMAGILLNGCKKEYSTESSGFTTAPEAKTITTTIQGQIYDENGLAMANATVTVGTSTVQSNKYGFFRFNNVSVNQNGGLVKAVKSGYFAGSRSLFYKTGETNFVRIQMIPRMLVGTIDAVTGGEVTVSGAKVALPANGVVKAAANSNFSGTVNVYAAYLDPSSVNTLRQMPGNLFGVQNDNTLAGLESYGMMAVELESAAGEKLQVATGSEATLTFPLVASATAPASIPLWYFDEASGFWKQDGAAIKTGNSYVGKVKHFSFWNCDYPRPVVDFQAKFVDQNGNPLVHKTVRLKTVSGGYPAVGYGVTDSLGKTSGKIPKDTLLLMEVIGECNNVIYSQNIGPYSAAVNLGTITVNIIPAQLVTVTGTLTDCSGAPVSNGFAILIVNNIVYRGNTNSTGAFSINFQNCSSSASGTITGTDLAAQQEGAATTLAISGNAVNAGTVTACGTTIQAFINYSYDNTNYALISPQDSLTGFPFISGAAGTTTYIQSARTANTTQGIYFTFSGDTTVSGTHLLKFISIYNVQDSMTITTPIPVTVTEYGGPSQFIAGSFSGTVTGLTGPHTVTGAFRVRRRQ